MGVPSAPRVTMADVARAAGVSVMTVSYCYSQPERVAGTTRATVAQAAQSLGYLGPDPAARSLRSKHLGSIGVVLGEHLAYAFDDPQARRFLAGVAAVCRDHQVGMTLIPTTGDDRDSVAIRRAAVDGFIVWTTVDADAVVPAAVILDKPVVVHGGPEVEGAHLVTIDDRAAARAVAAVVFEGASRPAVVSFPLDEARESGLIRPDPAAIRFPVTRNRLLGIQDYVTEASASSTGAALAEPMIAVIPRNERAASREVIDLLLDLPEPPDAILAMSDELAFEVADALRTRGRSIPDEVSVSGWDDGSEALAAGLTTVHQSLFEQGRQCAQLALGLGDLGQSPAWEVVRRQTTYAAADSDFNS
jgi:DNA-binding LacI/PurR family transcriptional regulator